MEKLKVALIGLGGRGEGLYRVAMKFMDDLNFVGLCDPFIDKAEYVANKIKADFGYTPPVFADYKECIDKTKPDCVVLASSWQQHIEVSIYCMEKGVAVGCEVGGAYSIESLWDLVRTYERTKTPIMMLENTCFKRNKLMLLKMVRLGLFGEVVHMEGAYRHDLRKEITTGAEKRHYRLMEYIHRNTENYPTHEIGPIAKILKINCGNRFTSLFSYSSKSVGLKSYIKENNVESFNNLDFNQGDIITTLIKCQNGETVTINLGTTLPRYYSRSLMLEGTKGVMCGENNSIYFEDEFDKDKELGQFDWKDHWGNFDSYYEKYDHKWWKDYVPSEGTKAGHSGIDYLTLKMFFDSVRNKKPMPVDVYDMATWMSISVLSEQSIMTGQQVMFPDFTDGKWVTNKDIFAKEDEE